MHFKYCNFVSYYQHAHKQEKLRRWPGAVQAELCCWKPTDVVPGDSHRGKKRLEKTAGNLVLEKLWPDSTETVGVQDPWELCCPLLRAAQPFLSLLLSQGSLGDAVTFITAVGSFCSFPFPVSLVIFSYFLYSCLVQGFLLGCIFFALIPACQPVIQTFLEQNHTI